MVAMIARPTATTGQHVLCRCCGYRLADLTPAGVRVVVPHHRREDGTIVARCPACRWKAFIAAGRVAA